MVCQQKLIVTNGHLRNLHTACEMNGNGFLIMHQLYKSLAAKPLRSCVGKLKRRVFILQGLKLSGKQCFMVAAALLPRHFSRAFSSGDSWGTQTPLPPIIGVLVPSLTLCSPVLLWMWGVVEPSSWTSDTAHSNTATEWFGTFPVWSPTTKTPQTSPGGACNLQHLSWLF